MQRACEVAAVSEGWRTVGIQQPQRPSVLFHCQPPAPQARLWPRALIGRFNRRRHRAASPLGIRPRLCTAAHAVAHPLLLQPKMIWEEPPGVPPWTLTVFFSVRKLPTFWPGGDARDAVGQARGGQREWLATSLSRGKGAHTRHTCENLGTQRYNTRTHAHTHAHALHASTGAEEGVACARARAAVRRARSPLGRE